MTKAIEEAILRKQVGADHNRGVRCKVFYLIGLVILLVVGVTLDLLTGPSGLSLYDVWHGLVEGDKDGNISGIIMWQVRLPTALLAILVGANLSLAGAEMQTILDNPLASPFTLGVSSAAAFGAALAIILGVSLPGVPEGMAVPVNAFVMAFGSVMLIQVVAASQRNSHSLVLFGIALVFGFNALVSVIQFLAPANSLQQHVFWTMGGLDRANTMSVLTMFLALVIVVPFSMRASWAMTLLSLGEERACSLGVNHRRLRFGCLFRASLLAAISVSFVGTIGFIGLIAPHIARLLVGEVHRFFLPAALLCGGIIMSFASIAAKTLLPGAVLPIGIVTSLIGLPCFIALLLMGRSKR